MKRHTKTKKKKFDRIRIVVAMATIIIIILIAGIMSKKKPEQALQVIENTQSSILSNNVVSEYRLKELQSMEYSQIKESIKTGKDFCIKIIDEKGRPVLEKGAQKLNDGGAC